MYETNPKNLPYLALPENIRLAWKKLAEYKRSSFFSCDVGDVEKTFYNNSGDTKNWTNALSFVGLFNDYQQIVNLPLNESSLSKNLLY
jgi:hypothetical protein